MTDQRDLLLSALRRYTPDDADEKRFLREITDFIKSNPHCFERTNQNGHVNGAAWVLSPDKQKVLLTHHKKLNRWFQPGGHSDGDPDTARVALREATEESGIPGIQFITKTSLTLTCISFRLTPPKANPSTSTMISAFYCRRLRKITSSAPNLTA